MHTVVLYSVVSGEDDESASARGAFCHPLLLCNYTMVIYHHIVSIRMFGPNLRQAMEKFQSLVALRVGLVS